MLKAQEVCIIPAHLISTESYEGYIMIWQHIARWFAIRSRSNNSASSPLHPPRNFFIYIHFHFLYLKISSSFFDLIYANQSTAHFFLIHTASLQSFYIYKCIYFINCTQAPDSLCNQILYLFKNCSTLLFFQLVMCSWSPT